jgi:inositol-hexakisphosphate kinase
MLVSYRRVPKGKNGTASLREIPHSSYQPTDRASVDTPKPSSMIPVPGQRHSRTKEENETDPDEAEMPEVMLDRNRHIVPEWVLRGNRNRSLSYSSIAGSSAIARRRLQRGYLDRDVASSPDLAFSTVASAPHGKPGPLSRCPPYHQTEAPTPDNSPSQNIRSFPPHLGLKPTSKGRHPPLIIYRTMMSPFIDPLFGLSIRKNHTILLSFPGLGVQVPL